MSPLSGLNLEKCKKYKRKFSAAHALYFELKRLAKEMGQNPNVEVILLTPRESAAAGTGYNWRVIWEAGPFEWGVYLSHSLHNIPHWYTEPYYSFDVCFAD